MEDLARQYMDLWQEHLTASKQIAYHVHTGHQMAFYNLYGALCLLPCLFNILFYVSVDPFYQSAGDSVL